ncbi:hypothetical protein EJ04DRAFT_516526 [Polyplosphaeria fusca]|uniref:Cytochrome b5 heme-binding domain-containing protein n=1 Tax=Polyplosphaeria fusca TaxID=682080 RepID=A0A9P4UX25_9PLEO|nr:hypothetical protein EJ04DRAFT_516526 [Polyplosphaeria fusca]
MLVGVSLLAISLCILVYNRPPSTWRLFHIGTEAAPADPPPDVKTCPSPPLDPATDTSDASPQTTPKAKHTAENASSIPSFSLAEHESSDEEEDTLPPPSFPALNSAQRASSQPQIAPMAPPPKPSLMAPPPRPTSSSLMPPPTRTLPSNLRALPKPSTSLNVPSSGPLPNRGPVPHRGPPASNNSLAPQPMFKTPNPRNKVTLTPGHSPLDWANLQREGTNLSGVNSLVRVTPSMLKHNNGRKGKPAWSSYQGKVYNISPYLPYHPGGEGELRRVAGKDGEKLFMETHPWVNWENMLGECLVGVVVSEEQASRLEDMD